MEDFRPRKINVIQSTGAGWEKQTKELQLLGEVSGDVRAPTFSAVQVLFVLASQSNSLC
jgi:hypothetical protein